MAQPDYQSVTAKKQHYQKSATKRSKNGAQRSTMRAKGANKKVVLERSARRSNEKNKTQFLI